MQLTSNAQKPSLKIILNSLGVFVVCASYSGLWAFLWELSQAFWYLPAGLRFVLLMYTRPVFWPVFLVGEWLAIAYLSGEHSSYSNILEHGVTNFMPSVIYVAVIGFLVRKKAWVTQGVINQGELVSITLAIIIAAMATAISLFLLMPAESPFLVFEKFSVKGIFSYSLGDIAGVLFIWSSVEFVRSLLGMDKFSRRIFARDAAFLILPIVAVMAVIKLGFEWAFLAMMFLPILFLALKHGWPGATFSLVTLNIIAGLSFLLSGNSVVLFDTQIFLVSVGFTGLFLGATISRQAELMKSIRNISQRVITTQETERIRISKDLHDHVGQVLTALTLRIAILRQRGPADLKNDLDLLDRLAAQVFHDVHEIVGELSPRELSYFGLKRSLESSVFSKMLEAANISYKPSIDSAVAEIPEQIQIAIFRISQEALSNIAKHSFASECSLK
ncbi:MAG TPA: histidine kinase, partial [Xanthomonadales bacterium]